MFKILPNFVIMQFSIGHYNEYITYLLGFKGWSGETGNEFGNASLSSLYNHKSKVLTQEEEYELILNLEFEKEDLEVFNDNEKILSVHYFVSSFTREKALSNLLD